MATPFVRNPLFWALVGVALIGTVLILGVFPALIVTGPGPQEPGPTDYLIYSDFAVYLNGEKMDFAQEKYMSREGKLLHPYVHLHNGNGTRIDVHERTQTLGIFFESLGMKVETTQDKVTFTTDTGEIYSATRFGCFFRNAGEPMICSDPGPDAIMFQVIINNKPYEEKIEDYQLKDKDKILIAYGKANELKMSEWYAQIG